MKKRIISAAILLGLALSLLAAPGALAAGCPVCVDYNLGGGGVSADLTSEKVAVDAKPQSVPKVVPLNGRTFLGWSLTDPATLKEGEEPQLVDPASVRVTGDTVFYAVYKEKDKRHQNYVVGFPDGTFGPEKNITRAQVATIIARAVLTGFEEKKDYGNPGFYTDINGHWAKSAIAYCTKYDVFKGYSDATFRPDKPITRQELALVVARLDGELDTGDIPFADADEVSSWARDGVYTAYTKGLIRGYNDNTFRPLNNISREETVTIFNRYLKRSVNAEGLAGLTKYVKGEDNKGEPGKSYMTWKDVEEDRWSYYEIIEAANDHDFEYTGADGKSLPEKWTSCWIDGKRPSTVQP